MIFSDELRLFSEKFQLFVEKSSAGLSKPYPICLLKLCEEKIVSGENFRISFLISNSEPFVFAFHQNSLHGDATTVLQVSRGLFWRKLDFLKKFFLFIFLDIGWKLCGLLAENARNGCQNRTLHVYGIPCEEIFWKKKELLINFGNSPQKLSAFCQNVLGSVAKLHTTCP